MKRYLGIFKDEISAFGIGDAAKYVALVNNEAALCRNPTVTFRANGGTGSDRTQTVSYGAATALDANAFTRTDGYSFDHWNTVADDSGTRYADRESVTLTADTVLYAQWKAIGAPTPPAPSGAA